MPLRPGQPPCYDSVPTTPSTFRNSFDNVIPSGTVASRVNHLQSITSPYIGRFLPSSIQRRQEVSRTSYGRRVSDRFAPPACRNSRPYEQMQVESSRHSFGGLKTPRINHGEEHALISYSVRNDSSEGLHGQIAPEALGGNVHHDLNSFWPVPTVHRPNHLATQDYDGHDAGLLEESQFEHRPEEAPTSAVQHSADTPGLGGGGLGHHAGTPESPSSFLTTSTIRRQSVRDLFREHGIERPPGLVSSDGLSCPMYETLHPARVDRYCHLCSSVHHIGGRVCGRCGHRYCNECKEHLPLPTCRHASHGPSRSSIKEKRDHFKNQLYSEAHSGTLEVAKRPKRPEPTPLQSSKQKQPVSQVQITSKGTIKIDPAQAAKPISRKVFRKTPPPKFTKALKLPKSSQTSTRKTNLTVRGQFANLHGPARTPPSPSIGMPSSGYHDESTHHHHEKKERRGHLETASSSTSVSTDHCDSPTCRATHRGHKPYRHSIGCLQRSRASHEATDCEHYAGASRAGDATYTESQRRYYTDTCRSVSYGSTPGTNVSHTSRSDILFQREVPKFVQCSGYPRTGHNRQRSPTDTGAVGECQHCLHDCQCEACQSTPHRVRCCTHEDHRILAHQHFKPATTSGQTPSAVSRSTGSRRRSLSSPARMVGTIVLPSRIHDPSSSQDAAGPQKPTSPSIRTQTPTSKMGSLQSSKQAGSKSSTRPPTPPPWVFRPRIPSGEPRRRSKQATVISAELDTDPLTIIETQPTVPPAREFEGTPTFSESESQEREAIQHSSHRYAHSQDHDGKDSQEYNVEHHARINNDHCHESSQVCSALERMSPTFTGTKDIRPSRNVSLFNPSWLDCAEETNEVGRRPQSAVTDHGHYQEAERTAKAERLARQHEERREQAITFKEKVQDLKTRWEQATAHRQPSPVPVSPHAPGQDHTSKTEEMPHAKTGVEGQEQGQERNSSTVASDPSGTDAHEAENEDDSIYEEELPAEREENVRKLELPERSAVELEQAPGVQGSLTVVLRLEGKEEWLLKADLSNGALIRTQGE